MLTNKNEKMKQKILHKIEFLMGLFSWEISDRLIRRKFLTKLSVGNFRWTYLMEISDEQKKSVDFNFLRIFFQ